MTLSFGISNGSAFVRVCEDTHLTNELMHTGIFTDTRYHCLPKLNVSWRLFSLRCSTTPLNIVAAKKAASLLCERSSILSIMLMFIQFNNFWQYNPACMVHNWSLSLKKNFFKGTNYYGES